MLSNSSCPTFGILDPIHFKMYKMTLVSSLNVSFVLKSASQVITVWSQDFPFMILFPVAYLLLFMSQDFTLTYVLLPPRYGMIFSDNITLTMIDTDNSSSSGFVVLRVIKI